MTQVPENNSKDVYSVTEVINELGLSRARFYQLQNMGVFPKPLYLTPKRPYYTQDLRQKCIQVRKTGIGDNGRPTVFYNSRKDRSKNQLNYERLADALRRMNPDVKPDDVKTAIEVLYPNGLPSGYGEGRVIRDLHRHFVGKV